MFIVLVDGRFYQAVDVATMLTCRPYIVSSPLHLHCIYIRESFADDNVDQLLFVVDNFMIVSM